MKFITYNIQDGGGDRLDDIVNILEKQAPDFLAINEANNFNKNNLSRLKRLSRKVGLRHYYLAVSAQSGYHIAILSKYFLRAIEELHPLRRAGVIVVIETDLGNISVAAVHLAPNTEDTRLSELSVAMAKQSQYDLRIIMGDLNSLSERDGYVLAQLSVSTPSSTRDIEIEEPRYDVTNKLEQSGYFDVAALYGKQAECTVPLTQDGSLVYRNLRLDYIFVSQHLKDRLSDYKVLKNGLTEKTSDHFPVVVEFKSKVE